MNDIPVEDDAPLPAISVTCAGDLWLCGPHRVLCGDATDAAAVSQLLGEHKPFLMVTDPLYGIELDSEWRDRGRAERLRIGRAQLPETSFEGASGNQYLGRHARRLGLRHLRCFRVSK